MKLKPTDLAGSLALMVLMLVVTWGFSIGTTWVVWDRPFSEQAVLIAPYTLTLVTTWAVVELTKLVFWKPERVCPYMDSEVISKLRHIKRRKGNNEQE